MMPPFYALGHFMGSNSYQTADDIASVVNDYLSDGIPIEGVFTDTYMKD
jgi:alpha-glucosidase (family GH31 glycosyl hydrolase)